MKDKVVNVPCASWCQSTPHLHLISQEEREMKADQQGENGDWEAEVDCVLSLPLANKLHPDTIPYDQVGLPHHIHPSPFLPFSLWLSPRLLDPVAPTNIISFSVGTEWNFNSWASFEGHCVTWFSSVVITFSSSLLWGCLSFLPSSESLHRC